MDAEIFERRRLWFVHALVRDAVYFDIPGPDRSAMHLRAAELLHAAGATAERVAVQAQLVVPDGNPWIVEALVAAADDARTHRSPDGVAQYLGRALEEPPAPELMTALMTEYAEALFEVNAPRAIDALRALLRRELEPEARADAQIALMQALALGDRAEEASAVCRQALAEGAGGDPDRIAIFETGRLVAALFGADDPEPLAELGVLRELPAGAGGGRQRRAGLAALTWSFDGGTAAEVAELALASLADDVDDFIRYILVSVAPLNVLAVTDHPAMPEIFARLQSEILRVGAEIEHIKVWFGTGHYYRGDLASAVTVLREALEGTRDWGVGKEGERYNLAVAAACHVEPGDLASAVAALDDSRPPADSPSLGSLLWWRAQTLLLLAEGRAEDAVAATHSWERNAAWMTTPSWLDWHPLRALALHRGGDAAGAREAAGQAVRIAEAWGAPSSRGAALRVRGEVGGEHGLADLRASVAVLEASPSRLELAKSLVALGAALRRDRQPAAAREPLDRGLALARACDAGPLAEQARLELAASGVRRQATQADGAGALTPSERRVAELAANSLTNREIAQQLYVTPKTVEVHLSASYRKLGIRSRQQLATALGQPAARGD